MWRLSLGQGTLPVLGDPTMQLAALGGRLRAVSPISLQDLQPKYCEWLEEGSARGSYRQPFLQS